MAGRVGKKEAGKSAVKPAGRSVRKSKPVTSQAELEAAFNAITELVMLLGSDYRIKWANKATATFLKLPMSKITGKYCYTLMHGTDKPPKSCPLAKMMKSKEHKEVEFYIAEKKMWARVRADPQFDKKGNIVSIIHTVNDITRQKQAEEEHNIALEKYRVLFESFPLGISITDRAGNLVETNKESERLLGLTRDGHLQRKYDGPEWQIIRPDGTPMPPDEYASVRAMRENRRIENVEMGIVKSGNEITWINVTAEPIPLENFGVAITYGDISARKLAEESLEREKRFVESLIDTAQTIILVLDTSGHIVTFNSYMEEVSGYKVEEVKGKDWFSTFLPQDNQAKIRDLFLSAISDIRTKGNINEIVTKDGKTRAIEWFDKTLKDANGNIVGLLSTGQDITDRKRAEEALLESENRVKMKLDAILSPQVDIGELELADILDIQAIQAIMDDFYKLTNISAWILDLKGKHLISTGWQDICTQFHRANPETCKNCIESDTQLSEGVAPGTFKIYKCKNNMWDLVTPITVGGKHIGNLFLGQFLFDDETMDYELFRSQARRYGFNEGEYLSALSRVPRWSRETVNASTDFYSKFAHMISTLSHSNIKLARSLTEKNSLLNALRESEEQYRLLSEHTTDTVWLMDMNLNITYHSPSVEKLRGFTAQEVLEMPLEKHVSPESLKLLSEVVLEELPRVEADPNYNPILALELEYTCKDGTTVWAESKFSVIRDETGKPVSILGEARDITERRKTDELLRESEAQYRLLSEHTTDTIWLMDMNLNFIYNSPSVEKLRGFTVREIMEIPWEQHVTPESLKLLTEVILREIPRIQVEPDYNPIITLNLEYTCKNGETVWAESKFSVIRDESGKPVSILGEARDITERKQAEEALRQSEVKYRTVLEQIEEAYYEVDLAGNLTFFNDATCRQLGYSIEELMGMNYRVYTSKDDMQRVYETFNLVYRTGKPNTGFSVCRIRKDGARVFTENSALPLQNKDGKIIGFRGVARDITKRLQAEDALRESEAQYRLLAEHMTDTVWLMDRNLKTTYQSPSVQKLRGFSPEEMMEMPLEKQLTPESLKFALELFSEELPRVEADPGYNPVHTLELEFYRRDGTTFWAETKFSVIRDASSEPVSMLGEARDITDRKLSEAALHESEEKYRTLFNKAPMGIAISTSEGTIVDLNEAQANMIGYTVKELYGKSVDEYYINPDNRKEMIEIFQKDGKLRDFEVQLRSKDGSIITELLNFDQVQIGGVGFIFATGRNVTGLRQAEKDLRESEAQYHLLAEHVTDFIWLMDMNLKPTYQSPSGEKFTGFTSEEIMELPLEKRLTPESLKLAAEVFLKDIPRVQAEPDYNPILTIELEVYRKDGTTMWSENKLSVIRDESGKPVSILGEGRDITERKEAERTIEKQREEYRTIFDAVRPMIAYLDKKGVIQRINKAGAITFGREPKEIVGKNMHDFFPTAEADRFAADDNKVMTSGKPLIGLIAEYTLPSGQKRWAQIDRIPYFDEHEDVIGVITLSQDITRRKLSEENLKKSLALVQKTMADTVIAIAKMVEMKDPFTAGHQIRVAQLAAAVAKKMNLTDEQATYLNTAATIHDIGKIYVPSDILSKPGKLGAIEFQIIQAHVQGSYDILKEIDFTGPIAQIVYQHHERMDGSGYPRGLKGPNILPEAKILIVADVVEAMSSHRPYRAAMGIEKALGEITRNRGIKYDEASVDACLEIFYNNEFEFKPV